MISFIVSVISILLLGRKKILISFYNLGLGGIQTKIIDVANELSKDTEYTVIVYLQEKTTFDRAHLLHRHVKIIYCPTEFRDLIKNRFHYLLCFLLLVFRPQTLLTSLEETSIVAIKFIRNWKLSTRILVNIDTFFKAEQRRNNREIRRIFNQADAILGVSRATYEDLKSRVGISVPPLSYMPNWTLGKSAVIKTPVKKKKDILFLGRFEDQKNPLEVLQFSRLLKEKKVKHTIHMYGAGTLESTLREKIESDKLQDHVQIHPISHKPKALIRKSKYLLVTSKYEGLSFSMLEAMSLGTVILTLNAPGVSELISDGVNGCIQDTVEALFEQFLKVEKNTNLYLKLQKNALKLQKSNYDRKTMMKIVTLMKESNKK